MTQKQLELFEKFFRLAGSSEIGEVRNAVNQMKRLLEDEGLQWSEFVSDLKKVNFGLGRIVAEPAPKAKAPESPYTTGNDRNSSEGSRWHFYSGSKEEWAKDRKPEYVHRTSEPSSGKGPIEETFYAGGFFFTKAEWEKKSKNEDDRKAKEAREKEKPYDGPLKNHKAAVDKILKEEDENDEAFVGEIDRVRFYNFGPTGKK